MPDLPFSHALVRGVSDTYADAITRDTHRPAVDLDLARRQHADYCTALRQAGVGLIELPAVPDQPDCCFVEDQAVVLGGRAHGLRSGSKARRAEAAAVAEALWSWLPLSAMSDPASADGGDLLELDGVLCVGRSARTNGAGVEWLREAARTVGMEVREVTVPGDELHLKSVCSPLDGRRVVAAEGMLRAEDFPPGTEVLWIPREEAAAANVLALGRRVLVAAGFPVTLARLAQAGYEPVPIDNSEFRKRDGALTCLSIRF